MSHRQITAAQFLAGIPDCDPVPYSRYWGRLMFRELESCSQELLDAGFDALVKCSDWNRPENSLHVTNVAMGVFKLVTLAIQGSRANAERVFQRAAAHCLNPNLYVAPGAFLFCEQFPQFNYLSLPYLRAVALCGHQEPVDKPISLRGLAFKSMYLLDPDVANDPELRPARIECARGLFRWAKDGVSNRCDEWADIANLLIWC
jgi:hypothetical protein